MTVLEIPVTIIGSAAFQALVKARSAVVMGSTSRGLFLHLSSGWVIFITPESYHGPLTLNFAAGAGVLPQLENAAPAHVQPGRISLPSAGFAMRTDRAAVWLAPPTSQAPLPPDQRRARLEAVVRQALVLGRLSDVSFCLPELLGLDQPFQAPDGAMRARLERLQVSLRGGAVAPLADDLVALLGLGSGLTPSGDDLVCGLLLALVRWGHILAPHVEHQALLQALLPQASRRTTTLSANLIECAGRGQANERLLMALDGIVCGNLDVVGCAELLAGWGNTSGLDALAGLALALLA